MAAIATRKGYGGKVTIPATHGLPTNLRVHEWRMDGTRDAIEDTAFGTYTNSVTVTGGMERKTIAMRAFADKADHPAMAALQSAISDQLDEPVAALELYEGVAGATGAAPDAKCSGSALLVGISVACVKSATVDYDLTFRGSGAWTDSS